MSADTACKPQYRPVAREGLQDSAISQAPGVLDLQMALGIIANGSVRNRSPPRGNTGAPGEALPKFFQIGEIPLEPFFGRVGDENWPAQRPPGYHTIHLGRGKPHILKSGTISKAKSCFLGVPLLLKTSPKPSPETDSDRNVGPRSQMWSPGPKISKLRAGKPCRTQQ